MPEKTLQESKREGATKKKERTAHKPQQKYRSKKYK